MASPCPPRVGEVSGRNDYSRRAGKSAKCAVGIALPPSSQELTARVPGRGVGPGTRAGCGQSFAADLGAVGSRLQGRVDRRLSGVRGCQTHALKRI